MLKVTQYDIYSAIFDHRPATGVNIYFCVKRFLFNIWYSSIMMPFGQKICTYAFMCFVKRYSVAEKNICLFSFLIINSSQQCDGCCLIE